MFLIKMVEVEDACSESDDWTEKLIVKYIGQKLSKVRWKPSQYGQLMKCDKFVTGSWDDQKNSLCLWDTSTNENGDLTREGSLHGEPDLLCSVDHSGSVTDIRFMCHDQLVTSSSCGDVTVYAINEESTNFIKQQQWQGLHSNVKCQICSCTSVSVNKSNIISAGEDGRINLLQIDNDKPIRTIDSVDGVTMNAITHVNSNEIATVGSTGQLNVWDLRTPSNKSAKTMFLSGERISLESLDRHPYQPYLHVTGAADGIIGVWDIRHERYPVTLIEAHDDEVWEVKFHPKNPDNLFTCSEDGSAWYWDGTSISCAASDGTPRPFLQNTDASMPLSQNISSPWLYVDTNKHKMETYSLLPFNRLPVNSIDIDSNALLCGTDGEAIIVVQDLPVK